MRFIEIFLCVIFSFLIFPLIIIIFIIIKLESEGPVIYWSKRIGKKNAIFYMPKFRTMKINSPDVATHLLDDPGKYLTKFGKIIRKISFDEIPQLYSIIKGDMTFVGPRPALHNQFDLIALRNKFGIGKLKPGITGLAQINGRDDITIEKKVEFDLYYLKNKNIFFNLKIIIMTFIKVLNKKNISH